jgi:signal peptidase I
MSTPPKTWSPPPPAPWAPDRRVAALLGLTLQWPAMLYLGRPVLAIAYFVLLLGMVGAALSWLPWAEFVRVAPLAAGLLSLLCALHAWRIAARQAPLPRRPDLSNGLIVAILWAFVSFMLLRFAVFDFYRLPSTAMYPSVPLGSFVLVRKLGYGSFGMMGQQVFRTAPSATPARGDVIIFDYPRDRDIDYIKRVVGLPGDRIEYRAGRLFIDGEAAPLERLRRHADKIIYRETLGESRHEIALRALRELDPANGSWVVPTGHYFVSGDNRDNSEDSRYWGFVPADHLHGVVVGQVQGPVPPNARTH